MKTASQGGGRPSMSSPGPWPGLHAHEKHEGSWEHRENHYDDDDDHKEIDGLGCREEEKKIFACPLNAIRQSNGMNHP